ANMFPFIRNTTSDAHSFNSKYKNDFMLKSIKGINVLQEPHKWFAVFEVPFLNLLLYFLILQILINYLFPVTRRQDQIITNDHLHKSELICNVRFLHHNVFSHYGNPEIHNNDNKEKISISWESLIAKYS